MQFPWKWHLHGRHPRGTGTFTGTNRRFEKKGEVNGFTIIDDYAHHPHEIEATLKTAQNYPHKTLWCIFQPHTYTRTKAFLPQFAEALSLADKVILVGDPGRVALVASHFDTKECEVESREFRTVTGTYQGKRITVTSTGIGCDNVDIVMNELDALANINFQTREENDTFRQLEIVRIGTCGGLQPYTPVGTYICSAISVGFDGLLNFYEGRNAVCDLPMERACSTTWDGQAISVRQLPT